MLYDVKQSCLEKRCFKLAQHAFKYFITITMIEEEIKPTEIFHFIEKLSRSDSGLSGLTCQNSNITLNTSFLRLEFSTCVDYITEMFNEILHLTFRKNVKDNRNII